MKLFIIGREVGREEGCLVSYGWHTGHISVCAYTKLWNGLCLILSRFQNNLVSGWYSLRSLMSNRRITRFSSEGQATFWMSGLLFIIKKIFFKFTGVCRTCTTGDPGSGWSNPVLVASVDTFAEYLLLSRVLLGAGLWDSFLLPPAL